MNIRSEQFPAQGTLPIGVSKSDNLPWEEKPLLLLPKIDVVNKRTVNPFGGFRSHESPFLLYPLQNTAQVEEEDKKLTDLYETPLEPRKENAGLAETTVEPPQTVKERTDIIESQQRKPQPGLPPEKPLEDHPDKKPEIEPKETNPLGGSAAENPIPPPTSDPPKKRKARLLV
jgi:hypothetical protein